MTTTEKAPTWPEVKPCLNRMSAHCLSALAKLASSRGIVVTADETTRGASTDDHAYLVAGLRELWQAGWVEVVDAADGAKLLMPRPATLAAFRHGKDWIERRVWVLTHR